LGTGGRVWKLGRILDFGCGVALTDGAFRPTYLARSGMGHSILARSVQGKISPAEEGASQ
jgi:hypothetical protein